jgi:Adenine deaminase C-terminal domain
VTLLPLPLAGLLSPEPYESVAPKSRAIGDVLKRAGCRHEHAFVTLSFLPLVVLPELHLSDKGLVEVGEEGFELVGPFEEGLPGVRSAPRRESRKVSKSPDATGVIGRLDACRFQVEFAAQSGCWREACSIPKLNM